MPGNWMQPEAKPGYTHVGGNNLIGNLWGNDKSGAMTSGSGFLSPLMSGIGTGVNAYMGMKSLGLAEDQFDFQKDSWEKNFAMMQDQYNRSLNNRRAGRQVMGGQTQEEINAIADHYDTGAGDPGRFNASGFNNPAQGQGTAYIDNTNVDQRGEVVKSRKRRSGNGSASDSAMLGISGNQGTTQPKKQVY